MTPERLQQVSRIYHEALACEPHARAAFVRHACGNDETLRVDVEALLAQPASVDSFLQAPAIALAARLMDADGAPTLLTGRYIGPYQLLDLLGEGGMGEVYRARDPRLERDVAVKVLPRVFAADAERLSRFHREARLLAALNHPHIAAIYGVEEGDGLHALVLELVEGPTLADLVQCGPLALVDAIRIAHQMASALEAAHERGIIHRDLKPANIKVKPDGAVKVLDFGLAKAAAPDGRESPATNETGTGIVLGTVSYMSPEQTRGQAVDKRTDIWAFGCVLFEMLTGRPAFAGATVSDTIAAILDREPDLALLTAATPSGIRRLLQRCLVKDARRRLRDIGDAHPDLDEAAPIAVPSAGTRRAIFWRRTLQWGPVIVAALGAGALAVTLMLAQKPPSFFRAIRLTATPAHEFGPALSPDGQWVAYLSDARGPTDVWVKFTAGGEPANLTASLPLEMQVRSAIGLVT
jgi:eukaryotic-like serine/threonine-protein kinase